MATTTRGYTRSSNRFPEIILELRGKVDLALKAGAEIIESRATVRCPDAPPIGEGLKQTIHSERSGSTDYAVVAGDRTHWYGHLVEFGTSHSPPHPFLIPAMEESRDECIALVAAALRDL